MTGFRALGQLAAVSTTAFAFSSHAGGSDSALQAAKEAAEAAARAPSIARDLFIQDASLRDVSMSPDGLWLAFRRRAGHRVELRVREIASGTERLVISDSEGTEFYWSGDGTRLWLPNASGIRVFDTEANTGRRIFRYDESRQQRFWLVDRNAPKFAVLREKFPVNGEWRYRYLAIDATGKTRFIHESGKALQSIFLDAHGRLRYSSGYDGTQFDTVIWKHDGGGQQELMRCPIPEQCRPVAYSGSTVWALAHNGGNLMSLQRFDAVSDQWQTLHEDPRGISDAISVLMQPDDANWIAIAYRPDRVQWHGRTAEADYALDQLTAALPGANLDIDPAGNGMRWLVRATKPDWQFDRHFLYDAPEALLRELFASERRGDLAESRLARMFPVQWRGHDGMLLHGYLFLPAGIDLESAPIVAVIHGGPYSRSLGEGGPATRLMVNRGYIVFKPNFRASTGYGLKYARAARGGFGKVGVLDDIITGLDHLLANGIGDAEQQAVVGHSFGGYTSLLAVSHHPDRFSFAVASAAPVDLAWAMEEIATEGGSALPADGPPVDVLLSNYGVPYTDRAWHEKMHCQSPLAHAPELGTPVYLWAGAKDDRVALESIVRYVAEAGPGDRPALLIDPDSGHNPRERLNVEALVWLIENAADKHFGGGVTPASPALQAFLNRNLRPVSARSCRKCPIHRSIRPDHP